MSSPLGRYTSVSKPDEILLSAEARKEEASISESILKVKKVTSEA